MQNRHARRHPAQEPRVIRVVPTPPPAEEPAQPAPAEQPAVPQYRAVAELFALQTLGHLGFPKLNRSNGQVIEAGMDAWGAAVTQMEPCDLLGCIAFLCDQLVSRITPAEVRQEAAQQQRAPSLYAPDGRALL